MAVEVVLDSPDRQLGRMIGRTAREFAGGAMLLVGLLASIAALPTTFFVIGLVIQAIAGDESETNAFEGAPIALLVFVWAISGTLALVGIVGGLRLLRTERGVVLFLRRFGYDDATRAVTFAATETIGGAWRLVTLDDAEIAPVGVDASTRLAVRVIRVGWSLATRAGKFISFKVFPFAISMLWLIIGIEFLRADDLKAFVEGPRMDRYVQMFRAFMELDLPFDQIEVSLPGLFALFGTIATLSFLGLMAVFVALLLAFPFAAILFFVSMSGDAVLAAEKAKTSVIDSADDLDRAAFEIQRARKRVFAPRLLVMRVANAYWQETVVRLGGIASAVLIDVSEPTENLIWELERVDVRLDERCVLIGVHERVAGLASAAANEDAASLDARLRALLEGKRVLAYTTDRSGMHRFARALRSELLTLQRQGTVFAAHEAATTHPSPAA